MKAKRKIACHNWELDGNTITVTITMAWKRRGGRKVIIAPDGGDAWAPAKLRPDEALIRALARAHRWERLLEMGKYRSAGEIAETEKIDRSFVNRLLRLTLLAPDIQEAILDGRQPALRDEGGGDHVRELVRHVEVADGGDAVGGLHAEGHDEHDQGGVGQQARPPAAAGLALLLHASAPSGSLWVPVCGAKRSSPLPWGEGGSSSA